MHRGTGGLLAGQVLLACTGDKQPTPGELDELHHLAHEQCFISSSIRTEVVVEAA